MRWRQAPSITEDTEIVLVDVDGLGDELAAIRRKPAGGVAGWWPIGVLLARALAEHRVRQAEEEGEPASMKAGILAPYRDQQQLWSPWVGGRSEQLLPHLSAAQGRGVRVHPVVLPRDQVNMHLKPFHRKHERAGSCAGRQARGDGTLRESMLVERLLKHERADQEPARAQPGILALPDRREPTQPCPELSSRADHGYGANPTLDAKVRKSAAYLFVRYSLPNG
jgi:hypothetical protein